MIYDFGCLDQPDLLSRIVSALPGAVAAFAVVAGVAAIGGLLSRSARFHAADLFSGWGFVAAIMTVTAVLSAKALPFATFALFVLMTVAFIFALKRRFFVAPFWLLALFPGLLILTAVNIAGIAKWDDFAHWVPNALYLFHNNGVPGPSLPPPYSIWPSYPYALPFLTYMASWLVGGFLMQGGAMINFLLLVAFASMLAEIPAAASKNTRPLSLNAIGRMAGALVLVTLANPGFNASFSVSSQGDTPTMVLTAALGLLLWQMTNMLDDKDRAKANALTLSAVLVGMALIDIKQSNLALLGLVMIGFLVVAAKNGTLKPAIMRAFIVVIPALALRFVWQHYVDSNMAASQVFSMRPLHEWRFDLLPWTLESMARAMIKSNGLTVLMLAVTVYGGIGLFRRPSPLRNFALMVGTVYLGYLAFLLTVYIGADFGEWEAKRATSFYRYSTHTALLGISILWMGAPAMWKKVKNKIPHARFLSSSRKMQIAGALLLVALLPIALAIHAEWLVPQAGSGICSVRTFGRKLAAALPDHTGLAVLEPETEGLFTYITNLELALEEARTGRTSHIVWRLDRARDGFTQDKLSLYTHQMTGNPDVTAILIPQALHSPVIIEGQDNAQMPLVLQRDGAGWKRLIPQ